MKQIDAFTLSKGTHTMRAIVQEYQENPSEKLKAQLTTMELKFLARSTGKKSKKSKGQAKQKPVEEEKQKD